MDAPLLVTIRISERLGMLWSEWFDGLEIHPEPDGQTVLCGSLPDQEALLGVLNRLHMLNLTLIAIQRSMPESNKPE